MSEGEKLFESCNPAVINLKKYVQESWVPLASATQLIESKVKDTSFCGSTGKEERKVSMLTMIRSVAIPEVTNAVKNNPDFKDRKRRNFS